MGSPTSDIAPKSKENNHKPNPPPSSNGGRTKRAKQEEIEEALDDIPKSSASTNGRTKRKGKDKEKLTLAIDAQVDEYAQNGDGIGKESGGDAQDEEEQGITRCPCEGEEDPGEGTMVMCEECHAWQHGTCMGFPTEDLIPDNYFCEQCRPDMYPDLIKRLKKARQTSVSSHHVPATQAHDSRSHSPVSLMKQTKRRNTMNSRDAAYDESLQAVIDASAAEALASTRVNADGDEGSVVGPGDTAPDGEVTLGGRRKRKRADDDASASIISERQVMPPPRDPTPMSAKASVPPSALPKPVARAKRPGGRKAQVQEALPADNEAANTTAARRQGNPRAKATAGHEYGSRRNQNNGVSQGPATNVHASTAAASRSYHNSHAYAVSQQPLLTSWNLPDYLAHLSHTLPTETPRPLEVRGFSLGPNGQEAMERTTERGVKVKWPGKRMSVGDMNKRVRALVEWVGREQASAQERSRRKETIEKALIEFRASHSNSAIGEDGGDVPMVLDGETSQSPLQERQPPTPSTALPTPTVADALVSDSGSETMKMMEELMEELIGFQERYGPVYEILKETPLLFCPALSARLGNQIWLKREDLQEVFSFKIRGAYNFMASLRDEERWKGVVTCSAGNHAQGVALSGQRLGIPCTIVMPKGTPSIKVRNVSRLGAKVVLHGADFDEAKTECARLASAHGLIFVPPYDDPLVIAGQGTIGLEILKQIPEADKLDAIFAAVGGGGLAAGICEYVKRIGSPNTKVIGVETLDGDAMARSLAKGERVTLDEVGPFSDGTAVKIVGEEPFRICKALLDGVVKANTDELCAAIKDVFEEDVETRSITEPAGALALAGLKRYILDNQLVGAQKRFVAVVSGANMNFDRLRFVADRAELGEGREALLSVEIPERPGSFVALHDVIHPRATTEFIYRYGDSETAQIFISFKLESAHREKEVTDVLTTLKTQGMKGFDISNDELAKSHARYMIGGFANVPTERIFRFEFPERPGALRKFLLGIHSGWNISLFHYRNQGADLGKVLAGIQVPPSDGEKFDDFLRTLGYPYVEETENEVYKRYLRAPSPTDAVPNGNVN
ncbi:hypothetical protein EUX98_g5797 [Antrodiella citrinella]|uniref:Threonine dehydratase n=1 Tax=Antrodiella citrinella TaxID=2447956 RepID=A0A4S4MSQ5_9APHY|nr:hypothetical protein EUX98_g5797 [Antrodiella citrinella]